MMQNGWILIVDNEVNMLKSLSDVLADRGYEVETAESGREALNILAKHQVDLVFTDLKMPGMDGIQLLQKIKENRSETEVVVFTGYGTIENAVTAMKKGAWDYILKPFDPEKVLLSAEKIFEHQRLVRENIYLQEELSKEYKFKNITGKTKKMQQIYEIIEQVAKTNSTVLIFGESGTGKELIAQTIHYSSPRGFKPFVKVSCAALSESVIESELFGHEKGAFTGAYARKKGRFELADNGTLFLDEIAETPPGVQVKLLRVLQEREFERVGGTETIKVDVRLISATNQDIYKAIKQKKFREDLLYRLNVVPISVPPLRERKEDIPLLAVEFLKKYALATNKKINSISKRTMASLMDYDWPGNVRELENVIERGVVFAKTATLHLPDAWIKSGSLNESSERGKSRESSRSLYTREKALISDVLAETNWNVARAARVLQISRTTLYTKIKRYDLTPPGKSGSD